MYRHRKSILIFVIVLFIFCGSSTSAYQIDGYEQILGEKIVFIPEDSLDQEQSIDDGQRYFGERFWCAQSFSPSMGLLTRVQLKLFRQNSPPENIEIKVRIRDSLDGEDLSVASICADQIFYEHGQFEWVEFDFDDVKVPPGEARYIIASYEVNGHDIANCYRWSFGMNNPYTAGEAWYHSDSGWVKLESDRDFCFKTYGENIENVPPYKPTINGPSIGKVGIEYNYTLKSSDFDGDDLYYYVDWDDGMPADWNGPYDSGKSILFKHQWSSKGNHVIKAKVKDSHNQESAWSDPLEVTMPMTYQFNPIVCLLNFILERFPFLGLIIN